MDSLKELINVFNNGTYNWVPHVVFSGLLVLALLIGFWLGRRAALYFGLNIILVFGITILVVTIGFKFALDLLIPRSWNVHGLSVRSLIAHDPAYLLAFLALPIFMLTLLAVLLLALIPYYIFRKKYFKANLKALQTKNQSTMALRWQGLGIAAVFALPVAAFFAAYSASLGNNTTDNLIYSRMTQIFTFNQITHATEDVRSTFQTASALITLEDHQGAIAGLFGDNQDAHALEDFLKSPEAKNALKTFMTSDLVDKNLKDIINNIDPNALSNIDLSSDTPDISGFPKPPAGYPLGIPRQDLNKFVQNATDALQKAGAKVSAKGLLYLFEHSGLISAI